MQKEKGCRIHQNKDAKDDGKLQCVLFWFFPSLSSSNKNKNKNPVKDPLQGKIVFLEFLSSSYRIFLMMENVYKEN